MRLLVKKLTKEFQEKYKDVTAFHYVFITPSEWEEEIREDLIRLIFVQANLISKVDHKDRLLFRSDIHMIHNPFRMEEGKHTIICRITQSDEYRNSTIWAPRKDPYFMLDNNTKDPRCLYTPRVFLWFPHHLVKDLKCPTCEARINMKGFNKKPRARIIIDLNEYGFMRSLFFVPLLIFFMIFLLHHSNQIEIVTFYKQKQLSI